MRVHLNVTKNINVISVSTTLTHLVRSIYVLLIGNYQSNRYLNESTIKKNNELR